MLTFMSIADLEREDYDRCLAQYRPELCEFAYGGLYCWREVYSTEFAKIGGSYVIKYVVDGENYYSPQLGIPTDQDQKECMELLLQYEREHKRNHVNFFDVGEKEKAEWPVLFGDRIVITEDRGYADYFYEAAPLRTFSGKALHKKRNHWNRFVKAYEGRFQYEPIGADNLKDCIQLNEKWCEENRSFNGEHGLREEERTARVFLENFEWLGMSGGLLRIDGKPCAYTIGEPTYAGSDILIVHIEKGLYEYDGIYPAIFNCYLNHEPQYRYINREEDMNIEGLRKSKLSYQPLKLVYKYMAEYR